MFDQSSGHAHKSYYIMAFDESLDTFFYEDVRLIPIRKDLLPPLYSNKKSLQQPDESATVSCLTKSALTALSLGEPKTPFSLGIGTLRIIKNEPTKLQVFLPSFYSRPRR